MSSTKRYNTRGSNSHIDDEENHLNDNNVTKRKIGRHSKKNTEDGSGIQDIQSSSQEIPRTGQSMPPAIISGKDTQEKHPSRQTLEKISTQNQNNPTTGTEQQQAGEITLSNQQTMPPPTLDPPPGTGNQVIREETSLIDQHTSSSSQFNQPPLPPFSNPNPHQRESFHAQEQFYMQQSLPHQMPRFMQYQAPYFPPYPCGLQQHYLQPYPSFQPPWMVHQASHGFVNPQNFPQLSQQPLQELREMQRNAKNGCRMPQEDAKMIDHIISDSYEILQNRLKNFMRGKGRKQNKRGMKKANGDRTNEVNCDGYYRENDYCNDREGFSRSNCGSGCSRGRDRGRENSYENIRGNTYQNHRGNGYESNRGTRGGRGRGGQGRGQGRGSGHCRCNDCNRH